MVGLTSNIVANRAILNIGFNEQIVSGNAPTFDNSTAGKALQYLYAGAVRTVARQSEYDFSRNTAPLVLSGNPAPFPWVYEYLYPANAVQVWQVMSPVADPNNPAPTTWVVANALVNNVQTKVIQTDIVNALAVQDNMPLEAVWDDLFTEAVVRLLASELAIALAGKPDTAQGLLSSGAAFSNLAENRES